MSDVNANIGIHFDTATALAQLRQLQAGLSKFNQSLTEGNVAAANAQKGLNAQLVQAINSTGKFVASQKTITSSTTAFTDALEKNKLSMTQYFRYTAAAATMNNKSLRGAFSEEKDILTRAMKDRVKSLQTQYIQLTNANGELVKVLQVVPKHLRTVNGEYVDFATKTQMAAQRQQFLNQLIKQGSTQLLNFGKNTQWAGRQLMVGLTIPLTMLGSVAAKTFREMEQATVKFSRVYGDMFTGNDQTEKAIADIQKLAKEFTKYGVAAVDTMNMAADAAAMGLTGAALQSQVTNATKLAVLGQVSQQQALQTTISLQNAFGISSEDLAKKINFLNAVENQTVLSISDLTEAIPKAAPVIKQLGGSVEDLAFFMTAMKEGGINAAEGANALKSGLASMINPSKKASEMLAGFGINIKGIVDANAGNLKGTVVGIARALDQLDPLNRARAIEQMFGKFQFSRISTLFQNITKEGSQASKAFGLAGASVEELAILSERELGKVENAVGVKFQKQIEKLKLQLMPIGKIFLQAVTPIVEFAGKILEKFNNLSDGTKKFVVGFIAVLGGIAPVALMTIGLVANGVANLIKFFGMLRGGMAKLNGQNNVLGGGFDYLTQAEIDNLTQAQALHGAHKDLITTFNVEAEAANQLAAAYQNAASQARALASGSPGLFNTVPGPQGAVSGLPKKFAAGGVVPGTGNGDTVPAMLTPGEVVLTKDTVKQNPELVAALQNGSVKKYSDGTADGSSVELKNILLKKYVTGGDGSDAFKSRMAGLLEGAMSETQTGVARVIRFAAASGEKITAEQTDQIDKWRKEMLKVIDSAGGALVDQVNLSRDQIKKALKNMSPVAGQSATAGINTYDLIDTHGSQNASKSFAHTETSDAVSYDEALRMTSENKSVNAKVRDIQSSADYLNNLPDSDPRKPKSRIAPEYRPVSGAGFQGITQGLNKDLDLGTAKVSDFISEFKNLSPLEAWGTSLNGAGVDTKNLTKELDHLHTVYLGLLNDFAKTHDVISDTDLAKMWQAASNDQSVNAQLRTGMTRASNNVSGVRLSGVSSDNAALMESVLQSGEVDRQSTGKTVVPKSGSAIGGEAGRKKRLGVFDEEIDKQTEEMLTRAENAAEVRSPSRRTERLGINIGEGLRIGLERKTRDVKSQAEQLANAAIPKVDTANQQKYDILKNDPEQRQIQKSIDRHYRGLTGRNITTPQTSQSTETSVSVDVNPKELMSDVMSVRAARKKALALQKQASAAEAAAAKLRETAAKWEEEAAKDSKSSTAKNAQELKKRADELEIKAAQLRISAAKEQAKIAEKAGNVSVDGEIKNAVDSVKKAAKKAGANKKKKNAEINSQRQEKAALAVAEAEEDLAKTTQQISNVEKQHLDAATTATSGTLTESQIKDTIVKDEQQIATNTESIKNSTTSSAQSDKNIAALDDKIEANKQAQASIPSGSQSGNGRLDINSALDQAENFMRDENGQVMMGSDGNPLINMKTVRSKRRASVGKYSGKIAGGLGTAAMVAGMAGAPPQVTAALGTAATIAQFAPMLAGLTGPQAIVAGFVALGVASKVLNDRFRAMAKAQMEYVKSTSATTDKMKKVGEVTGKVGASEIMAKRRENGLNNAYTESTRDGSQFGTTFIQNETGKAMVKSFVDNMKKVGAPKAAQAVALELSAYVSDGVMTAEQANSVADAIGINLKKKKLTYDIQGNLTMLIGPNGNDLLENPLDARIRMMSASNRRSEDAMTQMNKQKMNYGAAGLASLASPFIGATMLGFQQNRGAKEAAQVGALDANNLQFAQAQADAVAVEYEKKIQLLKTDLAATTNKEKQLELQKQITELTNKQTDAAKEMNLQMASALNASLKRFDQIQDKIKPISGIVNMLSLGLIRTNQANKEAAYFEALQSGIRDKYKGTAEESTAKRVLDKTKGFDNIGSGTGWSGKFESWMSKTNFGMFGLEDRAVANKTGFSGKQEAQRFQAQIELMMASGQLSPTQTEGMLDLFSGKLKMMKSTLDLGMRTHGTAKTAELMQMFSGFSDKKLARNLVVSIVRRNPKEFDRLTKTMDKLSFLDGMEINMEATVKTLGLPGLARLDAELNAIEEMGSPITKQVLVEYDTKNTTDLSDLVKHWDYLEKLDPVVRKEAIQTYTTLLIAHGKEDKTAKELWAKQWAEQKAFAKGNEGSKAYKIEYQTQFTAAMKMTDAERALAETMTIHQPKAVIDTKPAPGGGGGGGSGTVEDPLDFMDSLAMRLKQVRDQAFNARKPLASLLGVFSNQKTQDDVSKMFDKFKGIQQVLLGLNVPKEFRDYINSLDAEQLDKLKALTGPRQIFTYAAKKDKNGKVIKDKKGNIVPDKNQITGLTATGQATMMGYREAQLGEFQLVQAETIKGIANQKTAFNMLVASGMDASAALKTVEDQTVADAIALGALGKSGSAEMKQLVADTQKANDELERQQVISDMIAKNKEFGIVQQMPKLASAMKMAGYSIDQIDEVLSNPDLAKQLIDDLKDGRVDAKDIATYLNSIEARKIIEIQTKYNAGDFAGAAAPGTELVNKMFSIKEQLIRTGSIDLPTQDANGVKSSSAADVKLLSSNESQIAKLQNQLIPYQNKIKEIQNDIDNAQRNVELNFTRKIDQYQEDINNLQRNIELNFDRPIKELQDQSGILSHDLEEINHAADEINKKYDEQAKALTKVSQLNDQLIQQQQQQLGLADALSQGDIAAAAKAAQEMRATSASNYAQSAQDALEQARKNEIDALRGGQSGMSADQIKEAQYQIAQKIYELETDPKRLQMLTDIQKKQDEIYDLDQKRKAALQEIQKKEDDIYNITKKDVKPKQDEIDKLTSENENLKYRLDQLEKSQTVAGKTKEQWDAIFAKIDASTLLKDTIDEKIAGLLASAEGVQAKWTDILNLINASSDVTDAQKSLKANIIDNKTNTDTQIATEKKDAINSQASDLVGKWFSQGKTAGEIFGSGGLKDQFVNGTPEQQAAMMADAYSKAEDQVLQGWLDKLSGLAKDIKNIPQTGIGNITTTPGSGGGSGGGTTTTTSKPPTNAPGTVPSPDIINFGNSKSDEPVIKKNMGLWEQFKTWFSTNVVNPIKEWWTSIASWIDQKTQPLQTLFSNIWNWFYTNVVTPITNAWNGLVSFFQEVGQVFAGIWMVISEYFNTYVAEPIKEKFSAIAAWVDTNVVTPIKNFFSPIVEWIGTNIITPINNLFSTISTWVSTNVVEPIKNFFGKIFDGVVLAITNFKTWVGEIPGWITTNIIDPVKGFFGKIFDFIPNAIATVKQWFTDFAGAEDGPVQYAEKFKEALGKIFEKIQGAIEVVKGWFGDLKTWISDNIITPFKDFFGSIFSKVEAAITTFKDKLTAAKTWISTTIITPIKDWFGGIFDKVEEAKNKVFGWLDAIKSKAEAVKNAISSALTPKGGWDLNPFDGKASGGLVKPKYFANGGYAVPIPMGTDTVPTMLTPGEFVMSRYAVNAYGVDTMKAINSGQGALGDSVYNYNLSVNVRSDANADEIARTVMTQIRQIDSQRIRGVRV